MADPVASVEKLISGLRAAVELLFYPKVLRQTRVAASESEDTIDLAEAFAIAREHEYSAGPISGRPAASHL
jgi:hypothetical protein